MNFYLWVALMLFVSALWLIWFLYRPLKANTFNLEKSNIALGRQKQAELKQDLQADLIDEQAFKQANDEIAQTLAMEMEHTIGVTASTQKNIPLWLPVLIVVFLASASWGVYQSLTSQSIVSAKSETAPTLTQSISKIRQHVAERPDDAEAWRMLGLALFEFNDVKKSLEAYQRSYELEPKNIAMLVEYASTLASAQNNQFTGRVSTLVREALEIDENAPDALYLAGWVAVNAQQLGLAQKLWQKALSLLPEGQPDKAILQQMLGKLSQVQGGTKSTPSQEEPASKLQVTIKVALSDRLRQAEFSDHYLMIYVKAARGRPMPIAIQKIKLKDFTGVVTLTDANSVMPSKKLSQSSKVLGVARLSKSGSAMRQAGDIEALSQVIDVRDNPTIELLLK
ncbi:MAG: c-type cytochrome biogenesis protein CcmI [Gammaproteobacteria bacterium]|nr:c-type cytochrome biogenesis protein CcmI [Gammaproteobacteria bacterium]